MNRRELLKGLLAGGTIIAGELWMPGAKTISIPSGKVFTGIDPGGNEYGINSMFSMIDEHTVEYCGAGDKVVSVTEFYNWLKDNATHMLKGWHDPARMDVSLESGFRMINPEHLVKGTLAQDALDEPGRHEQREIWTSLTSMGGEDLFTDKIYITRSYAHRGPLRRNTTQESPRDRMLIYDWYEIPKGEE